MVRLLASAVLITAVLGTSACSNEVDRTPVPPTAAQTTPPSALETGTASPEPAQAPDELVIGPQALSLTVGGSTSSADYGDPEAVLALVRQVTGEDPPAVPMPPYRDYDFQTDTYTFTDMVVFAPQAGTSGGRGSVAVTAATVGGVAVHTAEGIGVGSRRTDAVAAGARDGYDSDQDGIADYLSIGRVDVPDTESLQTPGAVGILFVTLALDGDIVNQIQAPANDFSDL